MIYNEFYFFIRISGEYVFVNQCFQDFFIGFVIVVHLVTIKKFDICLLAGWSSTLFILLVNIFDHTFNLFINNIVRKPIVDESLFKNIPCLISRAKLISSSKTIFYKEVENIKQALINNGFPNYIVDEQIKRMIKNVNQQNEQCTTPSSQQTYIKLFYRNQMHYNYKSDEKILKTLIHKNILPTDPNKKIKLVIYYNKFKTSNLVIRNNSSPSIGVLQKTNVIYKFKCPLGDCISDNNNIYVGLTSTTLSRRLTMHLSDTSSIAQHLKKHSCPTAQLRKILTDNTTILEHQNNKQKLQILEALHIRNLQPTLNRINFQTSANVLKCL